jgi:hypothetical protein
MREYAPSEYHPRRGEGNQAPVPRRALFVFAAMVVDGIVAIVGRAHWAGGAIHVVPGVSPMRMQNGHDADKRVIAANAFDQRPSGRRRPFSLTQPGAAVHVASVRRVADTAEVHGAMVSRRCGGTGNQQH